MGLRKAQTCDRLVPTPPREDTDAGRSASLRFPRCGVVPADAERRSGRPHAGAWERDTSPF